MFFLKRKPRAAESQAEVPEVQGNNTVNVEVIKEVPRETAPTQVLEGSPNLFKKMFSFSGPEVSYENEAWAPEYESVGLFRKRRASFGEANSNTTDAQ